MAAREITLDPKDPHFTVQVALDGASYTLEFEWLDTVGAWFVSLYSPRGEPALSGLRVVLDWPIAARHRTRDVPPGQLVFMADGGGGAPGRYDLGARVKLYYVDRVGVAA